MKQFLFIVFAATVFVACNNKNGQFTVSGKIKNAPSDSVYLEKLSYNSGDSKVVDSAKIDKDGTYELSGADTQQNLYMLSFKNTPAVILVNDAGKINVDFDLKKNSKSREQHKRFH